MVGDGDGVCDAVGLGNELNANYTNLENGGERQSIEVFPTLERKSQSFLYRIAFARAEQSYPTAMNVSCFLLEWTFARRLTGLCSCKLSKPFSHLASIVLG